MNKPIERILRNYDEGLLIRNNYPSSYLHRMFPYFQCIKWDRLNEVPPPICVQIQISSSCSTRCEMCDHWQNNKEEVSFDKWRKVFQELSEFGVETAIFSGGEPLMREDIAQLLNVAKKYGLKVGLLTNGTMPQKEAESRQKIIEAIVDCVHWVAISIDGTPSEDELIRNPVVKERIDLLREFCHGVKKGPELAVTVTLQKSNISMNLKDACKFMQKLGIPQVNFKLATGARDTLATKPAYLLEKDELKDLIDFLYHNPLSDNRTNNLDYLRRCFAGRIFDENDATEGAPLRTFYSERILRCFTPFLFSMIDSNGEVYPCCHLFRDNHGSDSRSKRFREIHSLGDITEHKFSQIWNGAKYVEKRKQLEKINPNHLDYLPCGECTRHCQHNFLLTEIYTAYENNLQALKGELEELRAKKKARNEPIWF